MSKKTFMATIIISFAIIVMVQGQRIAQAESQYAPPTSFASGLTVYSPVHTVYDDENQPIWCNISISSSMGTQVGWGSYEIDGIPQGEIPNSSPISMNGNSFSVSASFLLPKLTDGHHWISFPIVTGTYPNSVTYNNEVDFTVEPTLSPSPSPSHSPSPTPTVAPTILPSESPTQQPTISILSPLNDSFFNVSLWVVNYQLTYETNSTLSWVGYSIDGSNNATVTGNSTFVHWFVSSTGYHTLTVYANDTSGNWANPQTVTYLVNFDHPTIPPDYTPTPSPSPMQQNVIPTLVIAAVVVAAVVVGLLVYFAKRKGVRQ